MKIGKYSVKLMDKGSASVDTVFIINGKQIRFTPAYVLSYTNEKNVLGKEGIKLLAEDAIVEYENQIGNK